MGKFTASAPCKAILFGEHYVVYGSPALVLPIEPRNKIEFSENDSGIALESIFGNGKISPDGSYSGVPELGIFADVANAACGKKIPPCRAKFIAGSPLKGVGTSASFCAAFAAGLLKLSGRKADAGKIFNAAQAGDLAAHAGKASGVDAKCASLGKPIIFRRAFSPPKYEAKDAKFSLPSDCSLFIADTFDGTRGNTGGLVRHFAGTFGISSAPQDAGEGQRQEVRSKFSQFWENFKKAKNGKLLGKLMNENHAMLKKRGVSSEGIEKAVSCALASGAYGAKMTGAGGEGGAVLVLCSKKDAARVMKDVEKKTGFKSYLVAVAKEGAHID